MKEQLSRDAWVNMLAAGVWTVKFKKRDGELRELRGTTCSHFLPESERQRGSIAGMYGHDAVIVYDLDIGEWRAFRPDSVKGYAPWKVDGDDA